MRNLVVVVEVVYDETAPDPINTFKFEELYSRAEQVTVLDVDDRGSDDEGDRWSILEGFEANESNKIREASRATGLALVGLVDEQGGGVIGYVIDSLADGIATNLNRKEKGE